MELGGAGEQLILVATDHLCGTAHGLQLWPVQVMVMIWLLRLHKAAHACGMGVRDMHCLTKNTSCNGHADTWLPAVLMVVGEPLADMCCWPATEHLTLSRQCPHELGHQATMVLQEASRGAMTVHRDTH